MCNIKENLDDGTPSAACFNEDLNGRINEMAHKALKETQETPHAGENEEEDGTAVDEDDALEELFKQRDVARARLLIKIKDAQDRAQAERREEEEQERLRRERAVKEAQERAEAERREEEEQERLRRERDSKSQGQKDPFSELADSKLEFAGVTVLRRPGELALAPDLNGESGEACMFADALRILISEQQEADEKLEMLKGQEARSRVQDAHEFLIANQEVQQSLTTESSEMAKQGTRFERDVKHENAGVDCILHENVERRNGVAAMAPAVDGEATESYRACDWAPKEDDERKPPEGRGMICSPQRWVPVKMRYVPSSFPSPDSPQSLQLRVPSPAGGMQTGLPDDDAQDARTEDPLVSRTMGAVTLRENPCEQVPKSSERGQDEASGISFVSSRQAGSHFLPSRLNILATAPTESKVGSRQRLSACPQPLIAEEERRYVDQKEAEGRQSLGACISQPPITEEEGPDADHREAVGKHTLCASLPQLPEAEEKGGCSLQVDIAQAQTPESKAVGRLRPGACLPLPPLPEEKLREDDQEDTAQEQKSEPRKEHEKELLQSSCQTPSQSHSNYTDSHFSPAESQQLLHPPLSPYSSVREWMVELPSPCTTEAVLIAFSYLLDPSLHPLNLKDSAYCPSLPVNACILMHLPYEVGREKDIQQPSRRL